MSKIVQNYAHWLLQRIYEMSSAINYLLIIISDHMQVVQPSGKIQGNSAPANSFRKVREKYVSGQS